MMPTLLEPCLANDAAGASRRQVALPSLRRPETGGLARRAAHWEFDFRSIEEALGRKTFRPEAAGSAIWRSSARRCFKHVHFGGGLPPLLYDLEADPGSCENLAGDPAFLPVRLEFAERLLAWRAEHLDQSLALSALTERRRRRRACGSAKD